MPTKTAMHTHRAASTFTRQHLSTLNQEQILSIAYDALYFAAASRLIPAHEDNRYAAGYHAATADVLSGLPTITKALQDLTPIPPKN